MGSSDPQSMLRDDRLFLPEVMKLFVLKISSSTLVGNAHRHQQSLSWHGAESYQIFGSAISSRSDRTFFVTIDSANTQDMDDALYTGQ